MPQTAQVANRRHLPLLYQHRTAVAATEVQTVLRGISGDEMQRKSKPIAILGADSLSVPERVLLFCVATQTDPIEAGASTQVMIVKNLLKKEQGGHLAVTLIE
jgi:hypothetical protein